MDAEQGVDGLVPEVFLFVDRRCAPDWGIGKRTIDFHDLTFIYGGRAQYRINGETFILEEGDILYAPAGSVREACTFQESPMHSYAFNFFWHGDGNGTPLPLPTVTRNAAGQELLDLIHEFAAAWIGKQPFYGMKTRAVFQLILHRLLSDVHLRDRPAPDPRVDKVTAYMIRHYARNISVQELAELVGLSPVYLGKLFKQNTGITCRQFLNRVRINNAELILSAGALNVTEVAEHCGYRDVFYFSSVFKSMKGYPPSAVFR